MSYLYEVAWKIKGSTMALDPLHRARFSCLFSSDLSGKEASYQSRELTIVTDRNLLEERVLSQLMVELLNIQGKLPR